MNDYEIAVAPTTDGGGRGPPDLSPREAVERYLNKLRVSKRESTVSGYYYQLKQFVEFCEAEGITSLSEITGWDLESFETERREQGLEVITLNRELGTLQNFLGYAARIELVDDDLPEKVVPPDVSTDSQVDTTRLHTDDAEALLNYYDGEDFGSRAHTLLALAWYTGARLGGLRALDIADYDADGEHVQYLHRPDQDTPLKNGRDGERAVGLPTDVCEIVDAYLADHRVDQHDDHGRRPLLTSAVGRPAETTVRNWMYLATVPCLHMACPHGYERETCEFTEYSASSQCPSSRSPHQVRTGSITWQLNRGVPVETVSGRVNTSVRVLKRHYDQPDRIEELEERRREHIHRLDFGNSGGDSK